MGDKTSNSKRETAVKNDFLLISLNGNDNYIVSSIGIDIEI